MSFSPPRSAIALITNSLPCVVGTSTPHQLTTGQIVRLHVPQNYGMFELNQLLVSITVIGQQLFTIQATQTPYPIDIDSTTFTPFSIPVFNQNDPGFTAEVLPVGSGPILQGSPDWALTNRVFVTKVDDATTNTSTSPIPF